MPRFIQVEEVQEPVNQSDILEPFWQASLPDPNGKPCDFRFHVGHVIDVLAKMPEKSVHCCTTSPPYWNLRDYLTGEWRGGDVRFQPCDHVERYKEEAHRTSTLGPTAAERSKGDFSREHPAENAAFQATAKQYKKLCGKCGARRVDHQIGSEPSPDCNTHGQAQCGGCFICSMVAVFRAVKRVLRNDGVLWLNLGDTHASKRLGNIAAGNLLLIPTRVALALQADGWILRQDVVWIKRAGMPSSVENRPGSAMEHVFMLTKQKSGYYFDMQSCRKLSALPASGCSSIHVGKQTSTNSTGNVYILEGNRDACPSEISIVPSVARQTECLKVLKTIGLKIGVKQSKWNFVADLDSVFTAANNACPPVSLKTCLSLLLPVDSLVIRNSPLPSGAVLSPIVGFHPFSTTLVTAKVMSHKLAFVPEECFAASFAIQVDGFSTSLVVWTTFSAHKIPPEWMKILRESPCPNYSTNSEKEGTGRNWRNSDLWVESLDTPHGLTGIDDELVGLDVTNSGYSGGHFAAFPANLIRPLIKSSTSEHGACGQCGAPWKRITSKEGGKRAADRGERDRSMTQNRNGLTGSLDGESAKVTTLGWQPSCECFGKLVKRKVEIVKRKIVAVTAPKIQEYIDNPGLGQGVWTTIGHHDYKNAETVEEMVEEYVSDLPLDQHPVHPCIVLDPFLGSGTTSMVCRQLGRSCIGIDLSERYIKYHAVNRVFGKRDPMAGKNHQPKRLF